MSAYTYPPSYQNASIHTNLNSDLTHRLKFLDALRFIAAGAVLFQHSVEQQGETGAEIVAALSPGVFGVVLFFLISGFVIPLSAKNEFKPIEFIIRRFFRIYPLVAIVFLALAVLGHFGNLPGFDAYKSASLNDWIANLLLVQDYVQAAPLWGVTWTLSLEFAWYGIFLASRICIGRRFDDWLSIIAPICVIVLSVISIVLGHRLPMGRIGMIYAAILGSRVYGYFTNNLSYRRLALDCAAFLLTMAVANLISFGYYKHPNITMNQSLYPWLAAPALFLMVSTVKEIRCSSLLNNSVLGWLGAVSFSIYMLHPFAISFSSMIAPPGLSLLLSLLLTVALSCAGYRLIEAPAQILGRRIAKAAGRWRDR